jgi:hypothetical protein
MGEYNYLVYEPTPQGEGIAIALFVDMKQASIFMEAYFAEYYNERKLAVRKIPVNGDNDLYSYMAIDVYSDIQD